MPDIVIAPTLDFMEKIYELSREGGPRSERFGAYVKNVEHNWGLVAYNPMAGSAAQDAVLRLKSFDAENVAKELGAQVADALGFAERITLAVVVRSKGLWTDRVATEIDERISHKRARKGYGVVSMWSREEFAQGDLERESVAEAVRVIWTTVRGAACTLPAVLAREGLAYALANHLVASNAFGGAPTEREAQLVAEARDVLGASTQQSDIAGVLYGDGVSDAMGWSPLGIPDNAGYRVTIAQAAGRVREMGAVGALKS